MFCCILGVVHEHAVLRFLTVILFEKPFVNLETISVVCATTAFQLHIADAFCELTHFLNWRFVDFDARNDNWSESLFAEELMNVFQGLGFSNVVCSNENDDAVLLQF